MLGKELCMQEQAAQEHSEQELHDQAENDEYQWESAQSTSELLSKPIFN